AVSDIAATGQFQRGERRQVGRRHKHHAPQSPGQQTAQHTSPHHAHSFQSTKNKIDLECRISVRTLLGRGSMPDQTTAVLRRQALPLQAGDDLDAILDHIGEASLVLMGEASHGTREFYQLRANLSKRLIVERGFDAIAVEADWPDALQVSRFVQSSSADQTAEQALSGFQRFPQWMWRNEDI